MSQLNYKRLAWLPAVFNYLTSLYVEPLSDQLDLVVKILNEKPIDRNLYSLEDVKQGRDFVKSLVLEAKDDEGWHTAKYRFDCVIAELEEEARNPWFKVGTFDDLVQLNIQALANKIPVKWQIRARPEQLSAIIQLSEFKILVTDYQQARTTKEPTRVFFDFDFVTKANAPYLITERQFKSTITFHMRDTIDTNIFKLRLLKDPRLAIKIMKPDGGVEFIFDKAAKYNKMHNCYTFETARTRVNNTKTNESLDWSTHYFLVSKDVRIARHIYFNEILDETLTFDVSAYDYDIPDVTNIILGHLV